MSPAATTPVMTTAILGTMTFGDTVDEATAADLVAVAGAAGVTEIDTAVSYAGGASEVMLGRILRGDDDVRVSSKVGMQQPETGGGPLSAAEIVRCARLSVDRLGRQLDTLYVHQPDRTTSIDATVAGLVTVLDEGLARRIGVSNHAAWQAAELAAALARAGESTPLRAQQLYNPLARNVDVEFFGFADERRVETVIYNPLAGGLLSGRYRSGVEPVKGRFATSALADMYRARYWRADYLAIVDRLTVLAEAAGLPLAELCIRWALSHPNVAGLLVGASRSTHLVANLAAVAAGPLPDDVCVDVDRITAPAREGAPHYAR